MQLGIYATDGGPHDATTYAMMATDQIVQIEPNAQGPRRLAGRRLQDALVEAFTPIFEEAAEGEENKLRRDPKRMAAAPHESVQEIEAIRDKLYDAFQEVVDKSEFKDFFAQESVRNVHRQTLMNHVATAIHERRSWHADENPQRPEAQKFRAVYHGPEHPNTAFVDPDVEPKRSKAAEKAEAEAQADEKADAGK